MVVVALSTIVTGGLSCSMLWHARAESRRRADAESANLIMKLREPWAREGFKGFLGDARKGDAFMGREGEIEGFLNRMETIAMFLEQKTLKEAHVKELFAEHFKLVKSNRAIAEYYGNARRKNKKYTFTNIARVLEKMGAWDV